MAGTRDRSGAIGWMARNSVAANLLMLLLILGGLVIGAGVKQEVFPEFKTDTVVVRVPYPGASPAEVESGIVVAVEEAVRGLEGVKRVKATAAEGMGSVYVQMMLDAEPNEVVSDVKNAVDRLTSLPEHAERPTVSLMTNRAEVISIILYGSRPMMLLRDLAEAARERLLSDPSITHVELVGAPPREVSIEVPQSQLRTYGMTLEDVARKVAATSVELPGGALKTAGGEVLLRTSERRVGAAQYSTIPMVTGESGTELLLGDMATVVDDFAETEESARFNGQPAIMIKIFRTGEQTPIEVADAVRGQLDLLVPALPDGVFATQWVDWSQLYRERMELMLRNAYLGLILVLVVLGLFLEIRLAFWVTMGIPISFLGALLLMPAFDVSINMISLFAFIVTLGMVVDDAIVVGENIFELRSQGVPHLEAAIRGAKEVAVPVCFSIATTIAAFMPMLFIPGFMGNFFKVVPTIVIAVLVISLIESLLILPAHLGHQKTPSEDGVFAWIRRRQRRVAGMLQDFIHGMYAPMLHRALRRRYLAMAMGVAILAGTFGLVAGGRIAFHFMPDIDGDLIIASVELPYGSPVADTRKLQDRMIKAANELIEENGGQRISRGIFAQIGSLRPADPGQIDMTGGSGAHLSNVQIFLVPTEEREIEAGELAKMLRERVGPVPTAKSMSFSANFGPSAGRPIDIELRHAQTEVLEVAAGELAKALGGFAGVQDINDGISLGKPQLDLRLTPEAVGLGLTVSDVARQVRGAFYGAEALRQQIGRNEVKIIARLPEAERGSVYDAEELLIRAPGGTELPLREAAQIKVGRSWPNIERSDGRRVTHVTADVLDGTSAPGDVIDAVLATTVPELETQYPGLRHGFGGQNREQQESMASMASGGQLALLGIFALLAIPFRSYVQPVIVMVAIPFGFVGAVMGHLIMGYDLSMVSVLGLIALAGVVVNDSLVLIDAANRLRRKGATPYEAIHAAGVRRFRPILLTSLTTFFGLMPMILETSMQARFLVPMAVSLGFGVLFATFVILLIVPAVYLAVEDVRRLLGLEPEHRPGSGSGDTIIDGAARDLAPAE